jgi:hypothetical protein
MKTALKIIAGIAVLSAVVVIGAMEYASESGEVVVLTTTDTNGGKEQTRLWIVVRDGVSWLRAGSGHPGWLARVRAEPRVEVERVGKTNAYRGIPVPEMSAEINRLMAEKYGVADRVVDIFLSRKNSIAVRLDPLT